MQSYEQNKGNTCFYINDTSIFYCIVGDCSWGKWSEWSQCSESCGTGFWERTRAKTVVESVNGTCSGGEKDTQPCQIRTNHCEPLSGTKSILHKEFIVYDILRYT